MYKFKEEVVTEKEKNSVFAHQGFQSDPESHHLRLGSGMHPCLKSEHSLKQWNITGKVAISFKGTIFFSPFSQGPEHT